MKKLIAIVLLVFLLSACPGAPLAWHVNLMDKIEKKTGSFKIELPFDGDEYDILEFAGDNKSGEYKANLPATPIKIPFPEIAPVGIPVDYSDQEMSVQLTAATIKYELLLKSIGDMNGVVSLQPYLTTEDGDLQIDDSKLGQPISFDLSKDQESFAAEVALNATQLKAVNDKILKIGFKISGSLQVVTAGEVGVSYELKALSLKNLRFAFEQIIPDQDGEIADFSDSEPIPSRVVGLKFDYKIGLKHDGDFSGNVKVQIYLAPIDESNIFQDKFIFGKAKDIDLAKSQQDISGNASVNQVQLSAARKDQKLRFGARVVGDDVGIHKGGTITFDYEIKKLDLTAYFTLLP